MAEKYPKRKVCPHCKYKTFVGGCCMSCGYGFVDVPILKKNAAKKRKAKTNG